MALMPYSVSPRVNDHTVGPNPRKNFVALKLNSFATSKCPVSCTITTTRMATMKSKTPGFTWMFLTCCRSYSPSSSLFHLCLIGSLIGARGGPHYLLGSPPRPSVNLEHLIEIPGLGALVMRQDRLDCRHDARERDGPVEKG